MHACTFLFLCLVSKSYVGITRLISALIMKLGRLCRVLDFGDLGLCGHKLALARCDNSLLNMESQLSPQIVGHGLTETICSTESTIMMPRDFLVKLVGLVLKEDLSVLTVYSKCLLFCLHRTNFRMLNMPSPCRVRWALGSMLLLRILSKWSRRWSWLSSHASWWKLTRLMLRHRHGSLTGQLHVVKQHQIFELSVDPTVCLPLCLPQPVQ